MEEVSRSAYERFLADPKSVDINSLGPWALPAWEVSRNLGGVNLGPQPSAKAPLPAAFAAVARARGAFESHDQNPRCPADVGEGDVVAAVLEIAKAWTARARGESTSLSPPTIDTVQQRRLGDARLDLRLLSILDAEPAATNLAAVRGAALQARSEGFVEYELFASLLLARSRRLEQRPHLSRAILNALRRSYPEPWSDWVEAEHIFAGMPTHHARSSTGAYLLDLYQQTASPPRDLGRFSEEARAVALMLGRLDEKHRSMPLPYGVRDAMVASPSFDLVLQPSRPPFIRFPSAREGERVINALALGPRPANGLVTLVEADPTGIEFNTWFRRAFGFAYQSTQHSELARVTLHRMRKVLEGAAAIDRDGDRLRLRADQPLLFAHPDAAETLEQRVLFQLGLGPASSEELAKRLNASRRSVQLVLQQLTDAEICASARDGRSVNYQLEDTSFAELTTDRLSGFAR